MLLSIELTDDEHAKLQALASAKRRTVQHCIKAFIKTCQPAGGDWKHPTLPERESKEDR